MSDVPMTRTGLDKMRSELAAMESRRPEIQKEIATARDMGDLKENAEYHAAREDLSMLNAKISSHQDRIGRARIIEVDVSEQGVVRFGATVKVKGKGSAETYELVGAGEDDIFDNKILATSPMGAAMLGKKVGDSFKVNTPRGVDSYKIMGISYNN